MMTLTKEPRVGIAVLALILVASGCGSGGGNSTTDVSYTPNQGISLQNFSSYPESVYESQPATVRITVKNTGEALAEDVVARLYGAPIDWDSSGEPRSFTPNTDNDNRHIDFGDLQPADAEAQVPSVPQQNQWMLNPPDLGERNIDYDMKTRVFYKYTTSAQTEIQLVRQDEFRNQGMSKSQPTLENSAGPITMEVRTRTPLIYYQDSVDFSSNMCFIVKNSGDGTAFLRDSANDQYTNIGENSNTGKVKLTIYNTGNVEFSSDSGSGDGDQATTTVNLVSGSGIKCFDMSLPDLTTSEISQTVPITVEADYGYYKSDETAVEVLGRSN